MSLSAYPLTAPVRAAGFPWLALAASALLLAIAAMWAFAGFACALFTDEIAVSESCSLLVRFSVAGPVTLLILCAALWLVRLGRE